MGIKSKAQLEVSEDEYNYKVKNAELQREGLRHDSAVTIIRKDLIRTDMGRERKKYERATEASGQSGSKSTYQRTAELCESYSRTAGGLQ